jgi:hypothetical protein
MPGPPKRIAKLLADMRENPAAVRLTDALAVAEHFFGKPRRGSGSHIVFKMSWPGDPRINLQADGREAKPYQVRQLLAAVDRIELLNKGTDDDG